MAVHHVYADANIFLDFFRFSDDDLGELEKLFTHLKNGEVVLYLPKLTAEEYFRNRDKVVIEQMQGIRNLKLKVGIPIFIRETDKAKKFLAALSAALSSRTEFLDEVESLATSRTFRADELIAQIFSKANVISTTPDLLQKARDRASLGNPPGKPNALGDRLNWESLLEVIPDGNDLNLLTRDSDYIASFPATAPNSSIANEWNTEKGGEINLYRGIKPFAKMVDETIVFASDDIPIFEEDPERTHLIGNLASSPSFSWTHGTIAKLLPFIEKFSPEEIETLLEIALTNSQVGGIMGDYDLQTFYTKVRNSLPWNGNAIADRFDQKFPDIAIPF